MQAKQTHPEEDVSWLIEAVSKMIRPVVRLAVGRISCNALVVLIRAIYVAEARAHLEAQNPDGRVTRSALALLCGMDGRAIQQYEEANEKNYSAADLCSEAAILDLWQSDEDFTDPETREPRELLVHGPQGTFQRLVSRAAGRAVTAQTALDRLLESRNIALNETGTHVRLIDNDFRITAANEKRVMTAAGVSFQSLGRAIENNMRAQNTNLPRWLQQDRWTFQIPKKRLAVVRSGLRELLLANIADIEAFLEAEEIGAVSTETVGVGAGWYYWESSDQTGALAS